MLRLGLPRELDRTVAPKVFTRWYTTISFTMDNWLSKLALLAALVPSISTHSLAQKATHTLPTGSAIDAEVKQVMARTHANGSLSR